MTGYATVNYSSNGEGESVVEITEDGLADAFRNADNDQLAGTGDPIDAAVDDPLSYYDFLVLDGRDIVFDDTYERTTEDE